MAAKGLRFLVIKTYSFEHKYSKKIGFEILSTLFTYDFFSFSKAEQTNLKYLNKED